MEECDFDRLRSLLRFALAVGVLSLIAFAAASIVAADKGDFLRAQDAWQRDTAAVAVAQVASLLAQRAAERRLLPRGLPYAAVKLAALATLAHAGALAYFVFEFGTVPQTWCAGVFLLAQFISLAALDRFSTFHETYAMCAAGYLRL